MMAGQLDFAVVTLTEVLPLAKDGKLTMIALTSTQKAPIASSASQPSVSAWSSPVRSSTPCDRPHPARSDPDASC